jgi:hypothetical protein
VQRREGAFEEAAMPIRFRCAYCNQLMGIARRKAGTVVRCPTCSGQVVVPYPEPGAQDSSRPSSHVGPGVFERSDFEQQMFNAAPPAPPAPPPAPPPSPSAPSVPQPISVMPSAFDAATGSVPTPTGPVGESLTGQPGIFLTPVKLLMIGIIAALLLALAFFLGMLVGRS